ncbi:Folylpolyglutamate synthetase [Colletotrichum fioriniae]|uniref:Folylpolyglutamate synthetase n=1 Tax=Colletotrichum fioriniae TaxID=710243 RepID=UPI0032DB06D3|nr:Folylpolyglutamate synthetase [Colletotrichum fioriniae]
MMATAAGRTYNDAVDALNTLQTPFAVIEARRKAGIRPDEASIAEMRAYLARVGYSVSDLDSLNVIHVAGTKGKGSTCAFTDSILARHRAASPKSIPRKVGLLISPHLIAVRERIRINGVPISEALFARYFFEVWDRLGEENKVQEEVKIAWHKAGIMKAGSKGFTVEQVAGAAGVLEERAREKGVDMEVVGVDPRLEGVKIRPDAVFQKRNASLAVRLAETALERVDSEFRRDPERLSRPFVEGLEGVVWRGRCEVKEEGSVAWYVDGAHTTDSLRMAARWYIDESASRGKKGPRALVFNQQGRTEAIDFLDGMYEAIKREDGRAFESVVFCTNVTYAQTGYKRDFVNHQYDAKAIEAMTVQRQFAERWSKLDPHADVRVIPTIEEALNHVRSVGEGLPEGGERILEGADAL